MTALDVVCDFCGRLADRGITHLVGGSVASGVWGEPRQTNDADLEIWLSAEQIPAFLASCEDPYIVSEAEVRQELVSREEYRVVQVMHSEAVFKLDCFLVSGTFAEEGMARSALVSVGPCHLPVASADYILLSKLRWFELGRRVSDRQWKDILALVRVQGDKLDHAWLEKWASEFGVIDLLRQALNS